ncbi:MAG: hypothetical protein HKM92_14595 [Arenibacter sp.]|nr:hypothetical protein [Arenibacter sp.]
MNKKRTRADKLRYGVPWFRGASCGLGHILYMDAFLKKVKPASHLSNLTFSNV